MELHEIKSSLLLKELCDRIGDQFDDPEPMHDDVFAYLGYEEMDWLEGDLKVILGKVRDRLAVCTENPEMFGTWND